MLQARGQRPLLHLDAVKLEMIFIVCTGHTVSPHQRPAFDFHSYHRKLTITETQRTVARCLYGKQGFRPMVNIDNGFFMYLGH